MNFLYMSAFNIFSPPFDSENGFSLGILRVPAEMCTVVVDYIGVFHLRLIRCIFVVIGRYLNRGVLGSISFEIHFN